MPPRRLARGGSSQSWSSLHRSEASHDNGEEGYTDISMEDESDHGTERSTTESPTFPTISDVHRALHPLQATADRVGKQVERFAENLDRMSNRRKPIPQKDCRHVLPLVEAYKKIASDTVHHLQSMHTPERKSKQSKQTKRRTRRSSQSTPGGTTPEDDDTISAMMTTADDLKRWEQEEQTWDLLGVMLQVEYPIPESDKTSLGRELDLVRPKKKPEIHRYSSEKEVWDDFLASDDLNWERHTVVEWLKRCADKCGQDIEQIVEELEKGADRGSGLWAHSWLFTKEAIKGQKRLRSWPRVLEPDDPGLHTSMMNSERTKALVTQLDPDAISRQGRGLEKQDQFFERATWLACWEMIRRGKDWDYIREWCQERVEGWRATALRGDPRNTRFHTSSVADWQSRHLWRKACAVAAKDGGIDDYERAVFGALSGYLPSVQKVCHSWDDHLFAHYNSYLLHSFHRHLTNNFVNRLPRVLGDTSCSLNFPVFGGQRTQSGNQIVEQMKTLEATRKEATESLKMLQGSLIAKNFDDFVVKQGIRLSRAANAGMKSKIIAPMNEQLLEGSVTAPINMRDHDLLRIMTHIVFVFQDLGLDFGEGNRQFAVENVVVGYVDYLSKAGKQQLLPLYASRLSSPRSISCLGRQLPFIQQREERQTMMRLMKQSVIDVPGVLGMQLQMIIMDSFLNNADYVKYPKLRILENSSADGSGVRLIRTRFIDEIITDDQYDLIHGFEWYMLLDGHWQQTMTIGTIVYKHLLLTQGLAAARLLCQTVTFSQISLNKSQKILGQMIDISRDQDSSDDEDAPRATRDARARNARSQRGRRGSSGRRFDNERELLLTQSTSFIDFENFFKALDALEKWRDLANKSVKYNHKGPDNKLWKKQFQKASNEVDAGMEPILQGWLLSPRNDAEAKEFKQIRVACLPELVLAYNTTLFFSSHFLSRDLLLKSMDLAALIATEDSDLAACFTEAKRMPELVDSFAVSSEKMIWAEDMGPKNGMSKKKREGKTLDVWSVRAPSPSKVWGKE